MVSLNLISKLPTSRETNIVSGLSTKLKLSSNSTNNSSTYSETVNTSNRDKVNSRTSNLLLSSSIALQKRKDLSNSMLDTVSKLETMVENYKDEVDPTKKEKLGQDIQTILSNSSAEISSVISNDFTLSSNNVVTSVVDPGSDIKNPEKNFSVRIDKISTYSDIGLSSIDLTDISGSLTKISTAKDILSDKVSSYDSTISALTNKVSDSIIKYEEENSSDFINIDNLSKKISNLVKNLVTDNSLLTNLDVESLIKDEEDLSKQNEDKT